MDACILLTRAGFNDALIPKPALWAREAGDQFPSWLFT